MSPILVKYVLKTASRDRLLFMMLLMIAVMTSVSVFLGSSALTETQNFAQVIAASSLRLLSVIGLTVFIAFQIRRAFDNREIEYFLATPIRRRELIVSFSVGYSVLSLVIGAAVCLSLLYLSPKFFDGYLLWAISFLVELIIITNLTLFFSVALRSAAVSVLSSLGFYVLTRLIGTLIGIVHGKALDTILLEVMGKIMTVISMVIPRLDLMAQTSWIVYGPGQGDSISYGFIFFQLIIFMGILLFATLYDFHKKEF